MLKSKALPEEGPDVLAMKKAAKALGVSETTLRGWDRAGRLSPHLHAVNGDRCYRVTAVEKLKKQIESGSAA